MRGFILKEGDTCIEVEDVGDYKHLTVYCNFYI